MKIHAKMAAIFKAVSEMKFELSGEIEGIKFLPEHEIKTKITPLFVENKILPVPQQDFKDEVYNLQITFLDLEDGSTIVASASHPNNPDLLPGGNVTVAEKIIYKVMFQISTRDDLSLKNKAMKESIFEPFNGKEKIKDLKKKSKIPYNGGEDKTTATYDPEGGKELETSEDPNDTEEETIESTDPEEVVEDEINATNNVSPTNIRKLATQVQETEELQIIKPKEEQKKEDEAEIAANLLAKINTGEWKVEILPVHAKNEKKAIQALDKLYANMGTEIYTHSDIMLCPANPMEIVNNSSVNRSNLKIRRMIIDFRMHGEEMFWKTASEQAEMSIEDIKEKLKVSNKTPDPATETPAPDSITHNDLQIKIPEMTGDERSEEVIERIIGDLKKKGMNNMIIIYAINKIPDLKNIDTKQDDGLVIREFLAKAPAKKVIEMMDIACNAG